MQTHTKSQADGGVALRLGNPFAGRRADGGSAIVLTSLVEEFRRIARREEKLQTAHRDLHGKVLHLPDADRAAYMEQTYLARGTLMQGQHCPVCHRL